MISIYPAGLREGGRGAIVPEGEGFGGGERGEGGKCFDGLKEVFATTY